MAQTKRVNRCREWI